MKKAMAVVSLALASLVAAGCTQQAKEVEMKIEQTDFQVINWKQDGTHVQIVEGVILADDKPVQGVKMQMGEKRKLETNQDGKFRLTVDLNVLESSNLKVIGTKDATIEGKPVSDNVQKELQQLQEDIVTYYPLEVEEVVKNKDNQDLVDVTLSAQLAEGEKFPKFGVEKFKVGGTVKDSQGEPVVGATVNVRRDGVEGFSMSEPSDKDGEFAMYYIPEDDENHYFYVHHEGITYTLPPRKTFLFPDDYGVNIDITLPEKGTIIDDKPPTLVTTTAQGALYKGILMGIDVGDEVNYQMSIPDRDGKVILTLPKVEWEKNPTFYQTLYRGFQMEEMKGGDVLSSDMIPKPKSSEPSGIIAKES